jgi:nicotinate-nucleotide adenylyltransferase
MEIALFGGSFDPPHVGHLLAGAYVLATEPVDELWFVPVAGHPLGKPLHAPFEHRAALIELAISDVGLARTKVSRIEAELGGEGRTVDLLEHLHRRHPDRKWALVLGSDLAAERPQWKRFDRIEQLARIIPLERSGHPVAGGAGPLLPEVSSTQVRALLASGGDASHLVPRSVLRAIQEAGTYRMTAPP